MTERMVARTDQLVPGDRIILVTPAGDLVRTVADVSPAGELLPGHLGDRETIHRVTYVEPPVSEVCGEGVTARARRAWLLAPLES